MWLPSLLCITCASPRPLSPLRCLHNYDRCKFCSDSLVHVIIDVWINYFLVDRGLIYLVPLPPFFVVVQSVVLEDTHVCALMFLLSD